MLEDIYSEGGFYKLCTSYDSVVLNEISLLSKVDSGEAETVAQSLSLDSNWILIDAKKCLKELQPRYPHIRFHNSNVILQMLSEVALIPDTESAFQVLNRVYNFNDQQKEDARNEAQAWLYD